MRLVIDKPKELIGGSSDLTENVRNFVECVKNNDPSKLNAPITEGFASAALCHLGNIATRVDRKLHYDSTKHQIINDAEANQLVKRAYRKGYELPDIG